MCTTRPEQLERQAHREPLQTDVKRPVEKVGAIFEWDVPAIDEPLSQRLILVAIRQALDNVDGSLGMKPGAR